MTEATKNPFTPVEMWENTMVTVKEGDDKKKVDAKHYKIRYLVGESNEKRFVDSGSDKVAEFSEKTIYMTSAIHRLTGDPFHYDHSRVESLSGDDSIKERTKQLERQPACEDHKTIEVIFESPGVECCAMTKEEAEKAQVPLQYIAGYMLGKDNGLLKIALSKTVLDDGHEYYENIHIIPEATVKQWACLE
ncbi:MAG: hypothetical protein JW779_08460 [Candidatus Thorarchaeota archaeon]|nr:hypothetical protein [Candidatus Thorarchaeota archaeon]